MKEFNFRILILKDEEELGKISGKEAGELLVEYTRNLNRPVIAVFAAAPSQNTFLKNLSENKEINWKNIYAFHLDEYIDLPKGHPNTFQVYLKEHIFEKVNIPQENIFYMKEAGESPEDMIKNYEKAFIEKYKEIKKKEGIYVAFIGIGVNGHIAFNEPGSDLWNQNIITKITIDEISVRQQYEDYKDHPNPEARYKSLEDVPRNALTLTVSSILLADKIFCMVPGRHKAEAIKKLIEGPITEDLPCSFLKYHQNVNLYLDENSAISIKNKPSLKPNYGIIQ